MKRLTLDDVREVLPDLDELRPIIDQALARSSVDPASAWSGSGRLGTLGSRVVDPERLGDEVTAVAAAEAAHLERLYGALASALAGIRVPAKGLT